MTYAKFRCRTSLEPNRMQIRENKGCFSFAFDSAHVKLALSHGKKSRWAGSSKPHSQIERRFNRCNMVLISWFCLNILGPSNPQNVKVQATSSVSIRVTWDEPAFPNGIIKEYIISYGTSRDHQGYEQTVAGNTMERILDGLDKFTTYFIKVRGKTSKMGNASKILNATTYEDSKYCVTASGEKALCL